MKYYLDTPNNERVEINWIIVQTIFSGLFIDETEAESCWGEIERVAEKYGKQISIEIYDGYKLMISPY